jgi:hypothetical protein
MSFRLPDVSHRVSIMGHTGSGKTQFGVWLLSYAAFDKQPYIIFDFKIDDLINSIENVNEMDVHDALPKHPGLYIVHPHPDDEEGIEGLLTRIHEKGSIGIYIDEGYMIPKYSKAFPRILTQGRSLHIPVITLTQRPVYINKFVFTESNFFCVFHLIDRKDRLRIQEFMPADLDEAYPRFHSRWFDVAENMVLPLTPVPTTDKILERYRDRLGNKSNKIFI